MSRTLSSHNQTEIVKTVTQPYYLIELGFTIPLYISTLHEIYLDGKLFTPGRKVKIGKITSDKSGNLKSSITFNNADTWASVLALADSPSGKTAKIYKAYATDAATSDMVMLFDGRMDSVSIDDSKVNITLYSNSSELQLPDLVIARPWFNWLPPAGTVITSGTNTIVLESAN